MFRKHAQLDILGSDQSVGGSVCIGRGSPDVHGQHYVQCVVRTYTVVTDTIQDQRQPLGERTADRLQRVTQSPPADAAVEQTVFTQCVQPGTERVDTGPHPFVELVECLVAADLSQTREYGQQEFESRQPTRVIQFQA